MGLDLLEIQFRIEKTFDVKLSTTDFADLAHDRDIAVGDIYSVLLTKLRLCDVGCRNGAGRAVSRWAVSGRELALARIGVSRDMDGQRNVPEGPVDLRTLAEAFSLWDDHGQRPSPNGSGDELQGHLQRP